MHIMRYVCTYHTWFIHIVRITCLTFALNAFCALRSITWLFSNDFQNFFIFVVNFFSLPLLETFFKYIRYDLKYIHRISVDFELEYVYFRVRTGFCSRKVLFSTFYYYKISDIFVTRTYLLFVALNFPRKNLIFFIDKTLLQNYAKREQNSANDKRVLFHIVSLENFKYICKEIYFIGV